MSILDINDDTLFRGHSNSRSARITSGVANLFQAMFESTEDIAFMKDAEGRYALANPTMRKLLGVDESAIIGLTDTEAFPPEIACELNRDDAEVLSGSTREGDITLHIRGADMVFHIKKTPVNDSAGGIAGICGIARDVSDRKRIETELRQYRIRTETILKNIQSGVMLIDAGTHRIIEINPAAETMIGAGPEEIIGRICHEIVCPQKSDSCPITDWGKTIESTEATLIRMDGERREILKTAVRIELDGVDCILESFIDISDRVRAEAFAQAHLDRFKVFFSSVNDAIFVHPLKESGFAPFIEVNDIACERYGYTRDEFLTLTAQDITKKADVVTHAAPEHRKTLLKQRHLVFESVHIRKNGDTFPVEINSNIVEQFGKPVILAVVRDITERKQNEEERARIENERRQAQKVESIGRLAGGIAHDLNNLLTPIIGFGELIATEFEPADERHDTVDQIVNAGVRARDLVRQLLAFSSEQTLEYRPYKLNAILNEFRSFLHHVLRKDISLSVVYSADDPTILADKSQIGQVVMNLSVNAQDSMPAGGTVEFRADTLQILEADAPRYPWADQGSYAVLSVTDTGCGMRPETLERIFEPYFTTKGEKGTGLGLATVYGIVNQHGGHIDVESTIDTGTRFTIYLPATDIAAESIDERRTQSSIVATKEARVLIVDDNENVLNLARAILTRLGYETIVAHSGAEALEILASLRGEIDLLLTDVIMPKMNGREVVQQCIAAYPNLKALYMSGYADDVITRRKDRSSRVPLVQKPFTLQSLGEKVRQVIEG